MSHQKPKRASFLQRLLHDEAANTILIVAASLVPLMAMVGGAIDAGRYYMTAARLQAACDAGALAARRAMTGGDFNSTHNQIAVNFFDQNFPEGLYGTSSRSRSFTSDGDGVVVGTVTTVLPTSIMAAFGFKNFNLNATCSADINISNTDIMFVLDVTGSMAATDAGGGLSRIQALRNAVVNFYDTVDTATSSSAQVRFGAVPYSMSINVLNVLPREYLANSHTYQSRRSIPEVISDQTNILIPRSLNNLPSPSSDQTRYNNNGGSANESDRTLCEVTNQGTFMIGGQRYEISGNTYRLNEFSSGNNNQRAGCRANVRRSRERYSYEPRTFDVSAFKTNGTVVTDTGSWGANVSHSWNGCIEEASTVNVANFNPVPAGAFDLDINLIPSTEAQRWKPALPNAIWSRPGPPVVVSTNANYTRPSNSACAAPSFRLSEISRTQLQAFVNTLQPNGNTYHDIGMIWGARLISPNGMFEADNTSAPNGDPIARHIVFMTDGQLEPSLTIYGMYGVERMDRRITTDGNATRQVERHEARFQAACRAAKNENISVWVVAFGTTLTQSLRNCASPGRAFEASNSAQLEAAFQDIAQKIAALRLTQ